MSDALRRSLEPAIGVSLARMRAPDAPARTRRALPGGITGVILNGRAHRNLRAGIVSTDVPPAVHCAAPATPDALADALADFHARGVTTLVVSGGDGTVRDVLGAAAAIWGERLPAVAVVPSGKTNALAVDLGVPSDWTVAQAIRAASVGRIVERAPIVIRRAGEVGPGLRGFLFGAGGFVRATALAQDTHRLGAFNGLAIALSLTGAIAQTLFGGRDNPWRRGDAMCLDFADGRRAEQDYYCVLASTLERLPLGIKPFGRERPGLKLLAVEAPPRRLALTLPALLAGSEAPWIAANGYHRADTDAVDILLDTDFILDGEIYEGGDLSIARGAPVRFVLPPVQTCC